MNSLSTLSKLYSTLINTPCLIDAPMRTDLVTVFDAMLTSGQTREILQYLYEKSNNLRRAAVLKKKKMNYKLKLHS